MLFFSKLFAIEFGEYISYNQFPSNSKSNNYHWKWSWMNMIKSLFFSYIFQRSSGKNDVHASQKGWTDEYGFWLFSVTFLSSNLWLKKSRYTDLIDKNCFTVECSEEYVHVLKPPFLMKVHELPDWKTNSAWTWQRLVSSLTLCCFDEGSWVCLLKIVDDCGTILFYISPTTCIFKKEMNMLVEHIS